jgi:Fic family protein
VRAAHFSTFIEGNRLTLEEAKAVIADERADVSGRERDVTEVRNYWNALLRVEDWARKKKPFTEELIKRLHALVENGPRAKPTPYRDGQNAIKNSVTGALIYCPRRQKTCRTSWHHWWRGQTRPRNPGFLSPSLLT